MLRAFRSLFVPKPSAAVNATYIALVARARNEFFYAALAVPDTLDGRFELIVLHLFFLQHRLRSEDTEFARALSEAFFIDLDRSLRELGIADTGVAHRIKKMGKAYHGRLQAYSAGLADRDLLRGALARNLYGTVEHGDVALLDRMADYVDTMVAMLAGIDLQHITRGQLVWPTIAV